MKKNLTGKRFGRLTAIEPTEEVKCRNIVWKCQCDCGNVTLVRSNSLLNGHTKSCGCLHKEQLSKRNKQSAIHKPNEVRLYKVWRTMIRRCENPNDKSYPIYGGRGINI